jgi:hypothetical protein
LLPEMTRARQLEISETGSKLPAAAFFPCAARCRGVDETRGKVSVPRWRRCREWIGTPHAPRGAMTTELRVQTLSSTALLDRQSMITTVRVEAQINRSFSEVVPLIRPEAWSMASCFKAIYPVKRDSLGEPLPRRAATQSAFERAQTPPSRGAWDAMYYEHVQTEMPSGGSAEFHNLLDIDFKSSQTAAELRFSLNQCISCRWGVLRRSGGIDVDRGYSRVEARGPNLTYVDAVKSIRYTPFERSELGPLQALGVDAHVLNLLAPSFLGAWMEELVLGCATALGVGARESTQLQRRAA